MLNSIKTNVCTIATNIPRSNIGRGTISGTSNIKTASTVWSPKILPKSLMERDNGLARWPIISIGNIRGDSHQTGPRKCLRYFMPLALNPYIWVVKKTIRAHAAVVFKLLVGGTNPGIWPDMLEKNIKNAGGQGAGGKTFHGL